MEITILLFVIIYMIGVHLGLYKILEKGGEQGWKAFIPVYGQITRVKMVGRPLHYVIYFYIPIVNLFTWYLVIFDLLKSFGKTRFYHMVLGAIFPYIFLPYLGFSDEKYLGKASELPKIVKSTTREWADAISFAIIAATLIRWSIMEAFTIPTPSMEKSLLVGDFLFVSKFHYGTRTPMTPLQIPLTHQKVPVIESQSYLPWIQLPQYRLPGLTTVKNNDVVVFNWPASEDCPDCPIDLKTNYIKRCIGIGGDVVEVRDGQVYVNNEAAENPELMQHSYYVQTSSPIRERVFESLEISDPTYHGTREGTSLYTIHMSEAVATEMKNFDFVQVVKLDKPKKEDKDERIFPKGKDWNSDWYGPITLPKEGMTIEINEENLILYSMAIKNYEHNENVEIKDGKLIIDGKELTEYTFKQNYYFMMGDNRHNSLDSRYWGFVPEDHIVGKGFFIWLSLDKDKSFLSKIRWSRFFQMIE